LIPILLLLPGDVVFIGTLYSLGATLSFTVAHASLVRLRMRDRRESEVVYRSRPNIRVGTVNWPLFAVAGGIATGASFLVLVVQNATTRWVGLGWMVFGLLAYVLYRRRFVDAPLQEVVKAPPAFGPELALEYRRILVPVVPGKPSDEALDLACRLAAERGARIVAVTVLEMPLDRPLSDSAHELESVANRELDEAVAIGDSYGVPVVGRLERARAAGPAIVAEAEARQAEIIVLGASRSELTARQRAVFGKTVDYVLKNAPCRTLVVASRATQAA
jgi:APA family basic amino acid/polyamine antiporter